MSDFFKALGYHLGLTKESRLEPSKLTYKTVIVEDMQEQHVDAVMTDFRSNMNNPQYVPPSDNFFLTLKGLDFTIKVENKELYNKVAKGDNLLIGYRTNYIAEYDYLPPNYSRKVLIDKTPDGYEVETAIRQGDSLESLL